MTHDAFCGQDKTNKVKDVDVEEEVEQKPSEEEARQAAVQAVQHLTESHGPAAQLPSRPILGVDNDLSGAALVRKVNTAIDQPIVNQSMIVICCHGD